MNGLTPGLDKDLKAQFVTVKRMESENIWGDSLKAAQHTDNT
jgi:hypothetical protein